MRKVGRPELNFDVAQVCDRISQCYQLIDLFGSMALSLEDRSDVLFAHKPVITDYFSSMIVVNFVGIFDAESDLVGFFFIGTDVVNVGRSKCLRVCRLTEFETFVIDCFDFRN